MPLLPNLFSALRLILAPVAAWAILERRYAEALLVCVVAGLTDALDGYLARRFRSITRLGAYLDPIADKVLLGALYLSLGATEDLPWWLVILVFSRDAAILAASAAVIALTSHRSFPPSIWGKLSTLLQVLLALLALAAHLAPWPLTMALRTCGVYAVALATAWSAVHYGWHTIVLLRR